MMTTVDALKALYVLLGGSAEAVENITLIPDMINAYENLSSLTAVEIDSNERTVIDNSAGVLLQTGSNGGSISLKNDGDISLDSNGEITVRATDVINVTCNNGVNISAPTDQIHLLADSDVNIKSEVNGDIGITAETGTIRIEAGSDMYLNADGSSDSNIYVKIGSGSEMTLENYIKQVAGIS